MFPARYFCNRFFAPRYFPKVGADAAVLEDFLVARTSSFDNQYSTELFDNIITTTGLM